MIHLPDGNVLIALTVGDHVHHGAAVSWWNSTAEPFATCPITEGALLRLLVREGLSMASALTILGGLTAHDRHRFWPDELPYAEVGLDHVLGHSQITDAYLAGLTRHRGGRLVTFDRGLAAAAPDVAELLPVG